MQEAPTEFIVEEVRINRFWQLERMPAKVSLSQVERVAPAVIYKNDPWRGIYPTSPEDAQEQRDSVEVTFAVQRDADGTVSKRAPIFLSTEEIPKLGSIYQNGIYPGNWNFLNAAQKAGLILEAPPTHANDAVPGNGSAGKSSNAVWHSVAAALLLAYGTAFVSVDITETQIPCVRNSSRPVCRILNKVDQVAFFLPGMQ